MFDSNPQPNPKKLFVGNLSYSVTEDQLRDLFGQYGDLVDVKLIIDRATGRSKGIAFVEFGSEDQAQKAIESMHNQEVDGRSIIVNVARPPAPRENRGFGGGGGGSRGGFGGGGGSRGGFNRGPRH